MDTLIRKQTKPNNFFVISTLFLFLFFAVSAPVSAQDQNSIDTLRQMGRAFAEIAEKASPAVVGIQARQAVVQQYPTIRDWPFGDPFDDEFFERFFGQPRSRQQQQPQQQPQQQRKVYRPVQGSGFIVSSDGYILTNNHVIKDAEQITVKLADGRQFEAKVTGTDSDTEVAVIKIDANNLKVLEPADSDKLEVGEWVIAIGNPFGLSHTVTAGIVSAKGRGRIGLAEYEDYIQTDAAINPGNSGGPLIDLNGKVVGINTAILGPGGNIGIGFAIPINMAKAVYDQLVETGTVVRGVLGVYIADLTADMAGSLGLKQDTKGVVVSEVIEGSAAEKAGLKRYDVVVEFNGEKVEKVNELRNRVSMMKPGSKAQIVVLRDGKAKTFSVELGEKSATAQLASGRSEATASLGLTVQNLTDELAGRFGYQGRTGVIVSQVESGSIAEDAGITPGMLIMEVNRQPVKNIRDFNKAIEEAAGAGSALLLIDNGTARILLALSLPKE
jgi:serine protease Do